MTGDTITRYIPSQNATSTFRKHPLPCDVRIGNSVVRELCADELTETDNSDVSKTEKQLTETTHRKATWKKKV